MVDIVCDVQQIDETGFVWTFLDEAPDPNVIRANEIVIAGDDEEPAFARVVDIVEGASGQRVHLEILPGAPNRYLVAAARAHVVATS